MDSQESSPAAQFESINSSTLNLLFGPTLTFDHELYWKASVTSIKEQQQKKTHLNTTDIFWSTFFSYFQGAFHASLWLVSSMCTDFETEDASKGLFILLSTCNAFLKEIIRLEVCIIQLFLYFTIYILLISVHHFPVSFSMLTSRIPSLSLSNAAASTVTTNVCCCFSC